MTGFPASAAAQYWWHRCLDLARQPQGLVEGRPKADLPMIGEQAGACGPSMRLQHGVGKFLGAEFGIIETRKVVPPVTPIM